MKKLKVAILGYGRSGRDNHAECLAAMHEMYEIAAVVEQVDEWRKIAADRYGCDVFSSYESLFNIKDLDIIVNALPSHLHFTVTFELLRRGYSVVCEKPLAKTAAEVDLLSEESKKSGSLLTVFQQTHFEPFVKKIKEVIDSGVIGRIVQITCQRSTFNRRWDWQTLKEFYGGNLLNGGSHALEQTLQFFGTDIMPEVKCYTDRVNTFGDAEDYVKMLFKAPGKPVVDLEVSSCCTFPSEIFNIQGSCGGIKGTTDHVEWKYFIPSEAPEQKLIRSPLISSDGKPEYCREDLIWYKGSWDLPDEQKNIWQSMAGEYYEKLYETIVKSAPLIITPAAIRLQTAILEECQLQNNNQGGFSCLE